jgi:hypothetical protein
MEWASSFDRCRDALSGPDFRNRLIRTYGVTKPVPDFPILSLTGIVFQAKAG